jgi:hypothetical protein
MELSMNVHAIAAGTVCIDGKAKTNLGLNRIVGLSLTSSSI